MINIYDKFGHITSVPLSTRMPCKKKRLIWKCIHAQLKCNLSSIYHFFHSFIALKFHNSTDAFDAQQVGGGRGWRQIAKLGQTDQTLPPKFGNLEFANLSCKMSISGILEPNQITKKNDWIIVICAKMWTKYKSPDFAHILSFGGGLYELHKKSERKTFQFYTLTWWGWATW